MQSDSHARALGEMDLQGKLKEVREKPKGRQNKNKHRKKGNKKEQDHNNSLFREIQEDLSALSWQLSAKRVFQKLD